LAISIPTAEAVGFHTDADRESRGKTAAVVETLLITSLARARRPRDSRRHAGATFIGSSLHWACSKGRPGHKEPA